MSQKCESKCTAQMNIPAIGPNDAHELPRPERARIEQLMSEESPGYGSQSGSRLAPCAGYISNALQPSGAVAVRGVMGLESVATAGSSLTPYYADAAVTIYHGDCREILPALRFDALVTDPVWPNAKVPLFGSDDPCGMMKEAWRAMNRPMRAAIHLGCDSDPRGIMACVDLPFFRVCWLKIARVGYKGRLLMTGDVAYLFGEPPKSRPGAHVIPGECMDADGKGKQSAHPCPRKRRHVEWLVNWWTEETDVICDPFMGGGTTGLACKNLGRRFLGIEIDERFCEMAAKRMSQEMLNFAPVVADEAGETGLLVPRERGGRNGAAQRYNDGTHARP